MNVLVTGADGFVGRHFCHAFGGVGLADGAGAVDLRDAGRVRAVVAAIRPDAVLHLAAHSSVAASFQDPAQTLAVNLTGTLHLLQALDAIRFSGVFLYIGSGDVYGRVEEGDLPVREAQPLRPRSPYAVSKVAAEALCYQWSQTGGFRVLMARPFNHIGPGQDARFAVADFARQIMEMRLGRREPVLVTGDLDVTRDFSDVRDVVRAYHLLLQRGENGSIYNVCSGRERPLRSLLEGLLQTAGVQAELRTDSARLRPAEQRRMVGDPSAIRAAVGWANEISLEQTLTDILDYWEKELR